MSRRHWIALIGLAFSAFIMNTSEFMPIGLLVDIAAGFSMTEAETGYIVSVYAWAVALLSVPLMVLASRFRLKTVLVGCIALFAAGQTASALAPSFALLIGARIMVAAAHAVFWSIATPLAVRVVGQRYSDVAVGVIVTGSSVAMVCGLPLGRAIGLVLGWRMTFFCVALTALATLAYLLVAVPRLEAGKPFSTRDLPSLFATPALRDIYLVTALFAAAHFTCYSYIEPFLQQVAGFSDNLITFTLVLYGAVCALWGAFYTAYNVVFQSEVLANSSEESSAVAMSAYSGIFNLGIGSGTRVGGMVVSTAGIADVGIAGAIIGAGSFAVCSMRLISSIKRAEAASAGATA